MNAPAFLRAVLLTTTLALGGTWARPAAAEDAQTFVQREHLHVTELMRQPAGASRDGQIAKALDAVIDFDELARRAFGQPCPTTIPSCTNHWTDLSDAQKIEARDLLRRLVEKNYKKNLLKTLDYEVSYRGQKEMAGDAKVRTEAKSKLQPRDPAVQVDYVVRPNTAGFRIVDIVTEGSSLTKNYYDQFHKMLTNPSQGYAHVVKKLNEKIAKKD